MYGVTDKLLNGDDSNITDMKWSEVFTDSYTILDLETSGLKPEAGDRIIEVGILEVHNNVPNAPISWVINPLYPAPFHIPKEVSMLTGITDTELNYGADGKVFIPSLMNRLYGGDVVGHNALRFDSKFLDEECKRLCVLSPSNKSWIDTAAIFKGWQLSLPDQKWRQEHGILDELENYSTFYDWGMMVLSKPIKGLYYNLPFACETLNVDTSDIKWHRAGADCEGTYRLREALKQLILG